MDYSSGDSDSAATWPVKLSGEGIAKPIAVVQPVNFAEARQVAEELSRFLRKPLVDSSTGERVTRDPEHLDESYRDRMRRTGEAVAVVPPEPPGMRSRVERTGEGVILHIPGPPMSWFHYHPCALSPCLCRGCGLVLPAGAPHAAHARLDPLLLPGVHRPFLHRRPVVSASTPPPFSTSPGRR